MDEKTLVEKFNHELYHHGTKGQKWGVRRYQNPDGSLTPAGKRRYGTKTNFERVQSAKRAAAKANSKEAIARRKAQERTAAEIAKYRKKAGLKDEPKDDKDEITKKSETETGVNKSRTVDHDNAKQPADSQRKKTPDEMSDEELSAAVRRRQLEQQYKQFDPNKVGTPDQGKPKSAPDSYKNKSVSEMSDEELSSAIKRKQMEQQYAQLNPKQVSKGAKFVNSLRDDVLLPTIKQVGKDYAVKKAREYLGLSNKGDELGVLKKQVDKLNLEKSKLTLESQISRLKEEKKKNKNE